MEMTIGDGLLLAVMGIAIVFVGLISLMVVIWIMSKVIGGEKKKPAVAAAAPAPTPAPAPAPSAPAPVQTTPAPAAQPAARQDNSSSTGSIEMNGVPGRTTAMLMAIVADELKAPLSELEFVSVKCTGEEKEEGK